MRIFEYFATPLSFLRAHRRWFFIGVPLVLIGGGLFFALQTPPPEIVTARAERGMLRQTVEAVGIVTSEEALKLHFPTSGVIAQVLVHEGDTVRPGQRLATLQAGDLAADVASSRANMEAALADLRELEEGSRPEDIVIAEAEVAGERASLQATKEKLKAAEEKIVVLREEAAVSLEGQVAKVQGIITKQLTTAETALSVVEDVLDDSSVHDALSKGEPGLEEQVRAHHRRARESIRSFRSVVTNEEEARKALFTARISIADAGAVVDSLYSAILRATATSSFTRSKREERKADLTAEQGNVQSALNTIDSTLKDLQDLSAGFDTKIATEESSIASLRGDILTREAALRTQEAQLALTRAGPRATDLDGARARLRQAQADLARSAAAYAKTILTAPVAGVITKVNVKLGELLATSFETDPAITMLGVTPYEVEVEVAEVDVPKVQPSQTGSVILDAYPGTEHLLRVRTVDAASTDVDGVPKYTVTLDFVSVPEGLRIGMQGDVEIVTDMRTDSVHIPGRAVIESDAGEEIVRIQKENGSVEEREVVTGMEGEDGEVEILSGVQEGETIIVLIRE